MCLIIGLGNSGKKYSLNRHNVGQLALDAIINMYKLESTPSKFKATIHKGIIAGARVISMKPKTFMNECGAVCAEVASFYKVQTENVIVLQDDLAMTLCKIRLKINGGDGGHNGIKSINAFIQNNYAKVKIGIGYPPNGKAAVNSHVLNNFTEDELASLNSTFKYLAQTFVHIIAKNFDKFSSDVNNSIIGTKDGF